MSIDQRDWYRNRLRKQIDYRERARFRTAVDDIATDETCPTAAMPLMRMERRSFKRSGVLLFFAGLPFLLQIVCTFAICGFIFVCLKIISQLLR